MSTQSEMFLHEEELEIQSQMDELKRDLESLRRLRSKYSKNKVSHPIMQKVSTTKVPTANVEVTRTPITVPDSYDRELLTWVQRCIFVLNELGRATVEDVVEKVREYEPDVTYTTAKNVVTNKLSKLNREGQIKADKTAKKYVYYM